MGTAAVQLPGANSRKTRSLRRLGPVDIAALRCAVLALEEAEWEREDRAKPNRFEALGSTRHIVLRFPDGPGDWRSFHDRAAWSRWRALVGPVLMAAVRAYGYARPRFPRVMLARMAAGGTIQPHVDTHPAARWPHKVHVPITTNPGVVCMFGGDGRHLPAGEAVEVNNLGPHWVRNDGDSDRIHLVFECFDADQPPPAWIGAGGPDPAQLLAPPPP